MTTIDKNSGTSNPPKAPSAPGNPESNGMGKASIANTPSGVTPQTSLGRTGSNSPFGTNPVLGNPQRAVSGGADRTNPC